MRGPSRVDGGREPAHATPRSYFVACWSGAIAVFLLTFHQPVSYVDSDPALLLPAAQVLLQSGSTVLDPLAEDPRFSYTLHSHDNRLRRTEEGWRSVSVGAPLALVPVAFVAQQFGFDMTERRDDHVVQEIVSAASCSLTLLLLIAICRTQVEAWPALMVATIGFLGTSLVSTLATGLWPHHFAVLVGCVVLLLLARRESLPSWWLIAGVVGLILVTGLVRPAAFLVLTLPVSYVALRMLRRQALLTFALVAGVLVLSVDLWTPLFDFVPRYYNPKKLSLPSLEGLFGILVSPSRGLLVLSPILLWMVLLLPRVWRTSPSSGDRARRSLLLAAAIWLGVTLWFAAGHSAWWGGQSYGTRHVVDALPAAVLLLAAAWRARPRKRRPMWTGALVLAAACSLAVHTGSGLFNESTRTWNEWPNIDRYRQLLWSWRYPQALASERSLDQRRRELFGEELEHYRLGDEVDLSGTNARFLGWHALEREGADTWRWSARRRSDIELLLDDEAPLEGVEQRARVVLVFTVLRPLEIAVAWDGEFIGTATATPGEQTEFSSLIARPAPGRVHRLTLEVEDTTLVPGDARPLGARLFSLRIEPVP